MSSSTQNEILVSGSDVNPDNLPPCHPQENGFFGAKGAKVSIIQLEFQILVEKNSHNCAENQHNFYLGEKRRVMLCLLFSTESVIQLWQFATRQNQSRALVNKLSVVASYNWVKILLNSYAYLGTV